MLDADQKPVPTISAATDTMLLKGELDDSLSSSKYAIGVYNKTDGSLTFYETPIYSMSVSVLTHKEAVNGSTPNRTQGMTARKLLGEAFGTSRVQSAIRSVEQSRINIQSLASVSQAINTSVEEKVSELSSPNEIETTSDLDRAVPPFDKDAESPDAIYPFEKLIPQEEFSVLPVKKFSKITAKLVQEMKESNSYPAYVTSHFESMINTPNVSMAKVKTLLYLSYLMRLYSLPRDNFKTLDRFAAALPDVPPIVQERLINLFTHEVPGAKGRHATAIRDMSSKQKDTLISYILVLALYIEGFSMDPNAINIDLRLPNYKLIEHFKYIGCSYAQKRKQANEDGTEAVFKPTVRLTAPLNFPRIKKGKK